MQQQQHHHGASPVLHGLDSNDIALHRMGSLTTAYKSNEDPLKKLEEDPGQIRCHLPTVKTTAIVSSVLIWIAVGLVVLCTTEDMHILSALYVLVQMVTTIGYGDLTVQSSSTTKVFLSFYVLFCCVVVGGIIISAADSVIQATHESVSGRMRKLHDAQAEEGIRIQDRNKQEEEHRPLFSPFAHSFLMFMAVLLAGTLFFGLFEKCTCGYSESKVDGCEPEQCEETGGYTKTFLDAWYMSCVSLTTIGFGDFAPKSVGGRIFAIVWMLVGVVAVGNFACQFSKAFVEADRMAKQLEINIDDIFDKIDVDGNGTLHRYEFLTFALMEYGIISAEDIDAVNEQFDEIDLDGSGEVTRQEICAKFGKVREADVHEHSQKLLHRLSAVIHNPLDVHPAGRNTIAAAGGGNAPVPLDLNSADQRDSITSRGRSLEELMAAAAFCESRGEVADGRHGQVAETLSRGMSLENVLAAAAYCQSPGGDQASKIGSSERGVGVAADKGSRELASASTSAATSKHSREASSAGSLCSEAFDAQGAAGSKPVQDPVATRDDFTAGLRPEDADFRSPVKADHGIGASTSSLLPTPDGDSANKPLLPSLPFVAPAANQRSPRPAANDFRLPGGHLQEGELDGEQVSATISPELSSSLSTVHGAAKLIKKKKGKFKPRVARQKVSTDDNEVLENQAAEDPMASFWSDNERMQ